MKTPIAVSWVLSTCKFLLSYTLLWSLLAILSFNTSVPVCPTEQDPWTLLWKPQSWNQVYFKTLRNNKQYLTSLLPPPTFLRVYSCWGFYNDSSFCCCLIHKGNYRVSYSLQARRGSTFKNVIVKLILKDNTVFKGCSI